MGKDRQLNVLFDTLRETFTAVHEAGYQTGRYVHTSTPSNSEAFKEITQAKLEAEILAEEKIVEAWRAIYNFISAESE